MFSSDEQSGTLGILVGIIVLVFAGIFISLAADKRFSFSRNQISLDGKIEEEKHELDSLRHQLARAKEQWEAECRPLLGQGSLLDETSAGVRAAGKRIAELEDERETAEEAVEVAADAFGSYRDLYRTQVRGEAVGEKLGELRARDGRVYKNVTIRKVTAAGVEIRHDEGNTRLLPKDLDPQWSERFQWVDEEVESQLRREHERAKRHEKFVNGTTIKPGKEESPVVARKPRKKSGPVVDPRLEGLRQDVIDARDRFNQARSEAMRARSEARSSRGRSVPGSLETWSERAARLESSSQKLHAQYLVARGKLASVAPNDSLLGVQDQ